MPNICKNNNYPCILWVTAAMGISEKSEAGRDLIDLDPPQTQTIEKDARSVTVKV